MCTVSSSITGPFLTLSLQKGEGIYAPGYVQEKYSTIYVSHCLR